MTGAIPWLPLLMLGAGVVSAGFLRYLWPYRHSPGGWFFIGTISAETLWTVAYGLALFVFDPSVRVWFEIPIWIGVNFIGVCFLGFALEYTGRGGLVRSPWMAAIFGLQAVNTAVVVTNPLLHLAWSGYRVAPVFGAATVSYTHTLWLSANFTGIFLAVAGGAFLLFDAFFSYGRLYRVQAAAIALSPVLPGLAFLLWLVGSPLPFSPPLNLTPLTFPVHLGFVLFAFFHRNMFERVPAARRASERTAIENLGSAVLVADSDDRLIDLNDEARRVLDFDDDAALGDALETVLPAVDPAGNNGTLTRQTGGEQRTYAVSTGAVSDSSGGVVGHTVVLQDVTRELRREQRLGVLNRVLRHNLRNDLNVVQGHIDIARDAVEDESVRRSLDVAYDKTADVVDLGEKARRVEESLSSATVEIPLADRLEAIASDVESAYPRGTVELDVPDGVRLRGTETLVDSVFRNLLENALEHNPADDPRATVTVRDRSADDETVTVEVRDDGPGIPDHELSVLEADEETPLEHGSGLGLWLVTWGVRALGGEFAVSATADGTTVTLVLPTVSADSRAS